MTDEGNSIGYYRKKYKNRNQRTSQCGITVSSERVEGEP